MNRTQSLVDIVAYLVSMQELFKESPLKMDKVEDPEAFLLDNLQPIAEVAKDNLGKYHDFFYKLYWFIGNLSDYNSELRILTSTLRWVKHGNTCTLTSTQYMIANTDDFIKKVFVDEPRYAAAYDGMVSVHGDKVDQYEEYWVSQGLDFKKAQIIYFLTFTHLLGNVPKHHSKDWVIHNYDKYAHLLP